MTYLHEIIRQGFPCLFQLLTGLYCPGCGGTRAVKALLHGHFALSVQYHPLVLYAAIVVTVEASGWILAKAAKNPRYYLGHESLFIYVGAALTIVNWAFKNYMLVVKGVDLLPAWRR